MRWYFRTAFADRFLRIRVADDHARFTMFQNIAQPLAPLLRIDRHPHDACKGKAEQHCQRKF